ncbi:exocyst complex protein exo70 [Rhizoctonia solani]|uniref:Exocyst complex protein EXO70 n=1 Tax=Rhizoctonia solani TaxID=456999 RepID=A0A8H8SVM9_9AGAM|nr:exocyst complex protein exo70 [Rhizoctonia solani]QRW19484.1 exocyst complex protein exo70 [Rhizoctonia solani]
MEDEMADIELLEQHLKKTSDISRQMTGILAKFDSRLVKLEKTIRPLHSATQSLTRLATNIDRTMESINSMASQKQDVVAEENLVLKGPKSGQLHLYVDALERLNANIAFQSGDPRSKETSRLVETGAKKLCQLYTKIVAEATSRPAVDPTNYLQSPDALPTLDENTMTKLGPVVDALRKSPTPTTHPSHPGAAAILAVIQEAQAGYADMRSQWCKKAVDGGVRRILAAADTGTDRIAIGREFGIWVEGLLILADAEYKTLQKCALLPGRDFIKDSFEIITRPLVSVFSSSLSTLSSLVKKSLQSNIFMALAIYSSLSQSQDRYTDIMLRRTGRKDNDLSTGIHSLKGVCIRSFPELLLEIKTPAMSPPTAAPGRGEIGTGIADVTVMATNYLEQIPDVADAMSSMLITLGDGNWRMGEGTIPGSKPRVEESTDPEQVILEHFTSCQKVDIISTVISTVNTISRFLKRPALTSIFVLNNISYLRDRVLLAPRTNVDALLSAPTQDVLNSSYRSSKAAYFDTNFTTLLSCLTDDAKDKKAGIKDKFARFYEALEEIAERHRYARVLADDDEGREKIQEELVRLVIPALQRFTQKHRDKEFSKNPSKYIKLSAEEVERQLRGLYK